MFGNILDLLPAAALAQVKREEISDDDRHNEIWHIIENTQLCMELPCLKCNGTHAALPHGICQVLCRTHVCISTYIYIYIYIYMTTCKVLADCRPSTWMCLAHRVRTGVASARARKRVAEPSSSWQPSCASISRWVLARPGFCASVCGSSLHTKHSTRHMSYATAIKARTPLIIHENVPRFMINVLMDMLGPDWGVCLSTRLSSIATRTCSVRWRRLPVREAMFAR